MGKSNLRFAGMSIAINISIDGLGLLIPTTRQVRWCWSIVFQWVTVRDVAKHEGRTLLFREVGLFCASTWATAHLGYTDCLSWSSLTLSSPLRLCITVWCIQCMTFYDSLNKVNASVFYQYDLICCTFLYFQYLFITQINISFKSFKLVYSL